MVLGSTELTVCSLLCLMMLLFLYVISKDMKSFGMGKVPANTFVINTQVWPPYISTQFADNKRKDELSRERIESLITSFCGCAKLMLLVVALGCKDDVTDLTASLAFIACNGGFKIFQFLTNDPEPCQYASLLSSPVVAGWLGTGNETMSFALRRSHLSQGTTGEWREGWVHLNPQQGHGKSYTNDTAGYLGFCLNSMHKTSSSTQ